MRNKLVAAAVVMLLSSMGSAAAISSAPDEEALSPGSEPGSETISNRCSAYGTVCVHATAVVTEITCFLGWCKFAETGAGGGTNGFLKLPAKFDWYADGRWLDYRDNCRVSGGLLVTGEIQGCGDTRTQQTPWLSPGHCASVHTTTNGESIAFLTTFEKVSATATASDCS